MRADSRVPLRIAMATALAVGVAGCAPTSPPGQALSRTTPSPAVESTARTLVVLDQDAVVEVDPDTGATISRHAITPGQGLDGLELVDVRDVALVTRHTGGGTEIVEVSLQDSTTRVVGPGAAPAVTSDGDRLAFVRHGRDPDRLELVVATYDGTELSVWPAHPAGEESLAVESLSWDPTGEELAFALRASTGDEVRVLPVDSDGTIRGASHVVPPTAVGAELVSVAFRSRGVVTVAEACCRHDGHSRWALLDVTLATAAPTTLTADLDRPVSHLDWTPDQEHLAVSVDRRPPSVSRWSPDGLDQVVADATSGEW